jgi:hypothetical protein
LSEKNAEYDAAKEAQGMLEMEKLLRRHYWCSCWLDESQMHTSKALVLSTGE